MSGYGGYGSSAAVNPKTNLATAQKLTTYVKMGGIGRFKC